MTDLFCTSNTICWLPNWNQPDNRVEKLVSYCCKTVHFIFSSTDVAVGLLTSCLSEAVEFLSKNHMLIGEIFDLLAQGEAVRGTLLDFLQPI